MRAFIVLCLVATVFAQFNPKWLLQKNTLSDPLAVCNDGSPAIYYFRPSADGNTNWAIYLQGGFYCFNNASCEARWEASPALMTSYGFPDAINGSGIGSADPTQNDDFYDWNAVYVPYCSSDFWSGNATQADNQGVSKWAFMGSQIVIAVLADLVNNYDMADAETVLFTGGSAGGIGVVVNADRANEYLQEYVPNLQFYAVADSGWFIPDGPLYDTMNCSTVYNCPARNGTQMAYDMWRAQPPQACVDAGMTWECFFGVNAFATMQSPILVFQYLYDAAQLLVGGIESMPTGTQQLQYADMIRQQLEDSVTDQPVPAYFLPSCYYHEILTFSAFGSLQIQNQNVSDVIAAWVNGESSSTSANVQLIDQCSTPNCNPTCPTYA